MSAADGPVRSREDASASLATLTTFGRQADISWLHLSRKQDRHRRGRSITDAFRQFQILNERNDMKPILRYRSQLLFRKSYKLNRAMRIRLVPRVNLAFRPVNRFGSKPRLEVVP